MMNATVTTEQLRVLLVEDSKLQAVMFRYVAEQLESLDLLHIAGDGDEAIAFLRRQAPFEAVEPPDLVLLDINMPGKDGFQVLNELKADSALHTIPIVMFTSSEHPEDVTKGYAGGASSFIVKSADSATLKEQLLSLVKYWTRTVLLPPTAVA